MRSDEQIKQAILEELRWDPRVEQQHIKVEVQQGVVTLTGSVTSNVRRIAAQEAAHRVEGVHDVANDIVVRVPGEFRRSDTALAAAVRQALEWDVMVPDERIITTISDGWVTLEGEVSFWHQREDAERAVRNLGGVRGVINRIAVETPVVDAHELRDEIEEALARRAERAAKHINIAVKDDIVTITGPVRSWRDKEAVMGVARHTPGVRAVVDLLHIDPTA